MTNGELPPAPRPFPITEGADLCTAIVDRLETVIVGKRPQLELILGGVASGGHVLIEDLPGLGKTLLARSLAQVTGLTVGRIQFTPDLMPADVTGSLLYDQHERRFEFRPGPVFHNVVLGDEINRAPPKTQAALLEAMQEGQVTVDGVSHRLPRPFVVLATQNPIEFEGTFPLPEAQVDRFLLGTSLGYPSAADDAEIIRRRLQRRTDEVVLDPLVGPEAVVRLQATLETVTVTDAIIDYAVALVHATRSDPQVHAGASPRGVEALIKLAPGPSPARPARLRGPRRHQGRGRARAGPPHRAPSGVVGAGDRGRRGRGPLSRYGADPGHPPGRGSATARRSSMTAMGAGHRHPARHTSWWRDRLR